MNTYDSTVKRASALRPGDLLIGLDTRGESLYPVESVKVGEWRVARTGRRERRVRIDLEGPSRTIVLTDGDVRVAHPETVPR